MITRKIQTICLLWAVSALALSVGCVGPADTSDDAEDDDAAFAAADTGDEGVAQTQDALWGFRMGYDQWVYGGCDDGCGGFGTAVIVAGTYGYPGGLFGYGQFGWPYGVWDGAWDGAFAGSGCGCDGIDTTVIVDGDGGCSCGDGVDTTVITGG